MRQPEVTRLARLLLALLLVVPVVQAGASMALAVAFLVEFLSEGRSRPLSALTREPGSAPLAVPGVAVDRFTPAGAGRPLVLVHGLTPEGKDDPRARAAAALLARAGFDVALPTVPGLTRARLRRDDVEAVVATLAARAAPAVVVGVSVGAGPALLAAADARVRDRVRAVLTLGGYASARELIRFHLTGTYGFAGISGRVRPDPRAVDLVVAANADLLDASARALVAARDPAAAERALTALSPELGRLLDALSPLSVVGDLPRPRGGRPRRDRLARGRPRPVAGRVRPAGSGLIGRCAGTRRFPERNRGWRTGHESWDNPAVLLLVMDVPARRGCGGLVVMTRGYGSLLALVALVPLCSPPPATAQLDKAGVVTTLQGRCASARCSPSRRCRAARRWTSRSARWRSRS
ncbi:MAG: hypothetical protein HYS77_11455 [Candidatus Rokubacteria bacterium]|nr:hypothetical protein [Candidatus Rokubacteria bacterium]